MNITLTILGAFLTGAAAVVMLITIWLPLESPARKPADRCARCHTRLGPLQHTFCDPCMEHMTGQYARTLREEEAHHRN